MTAVMLLNLVGLLIYFGLEKLAYYTDNWTTTGDSFLLYSRSFAGRSIISRNKFFSLWGFLHVSDIDTEDLSDRLCKVRPMMEHLNDSSQRYFQPDLNISIDERMVKSKGHFQCASTSRVSQSSGASSCGVCVTLKLVILIALQCTGESKEKYDQVMV